ncbi:glutathione S-transferase family protein [Psychromonas sp. MME2]|uniref:glutathione S-transferase family protein n=1 Tax=unclassified Psychromonas TaxID=2614957 RepID=UPI00339CE681
MMILHIANKNYSSWSLRPWVLMKELDIPFTEEFHPFGKQANWDDYKKVNPAGLVPCLIDNELLIWDSLAIIEFLAEQYPQVWPNDQKARAWARSASAEMHSGFSALRTACSMSCGLRATLHDMTPALLKDIKRIDDIWQEGLQKFSGPFLAGSQFTAVDAFYAPVAFRIQTYSLDLSPISSAYLQRLLAVPAMQLWYEQALQEKDREENHEAEIESFATTTADFRNI